MLTYPCIPEAFLPLNCPFNIPFYYSMMTFTKQVQKILIDLLTIDWKIKVTDLLCLSN